VIEAARAYLQRGLSVIPVGSDKRPLVKWEPYQTEAPHADQIDEWWGAQFPEANVGVVTGAVSGVVVLDADGQEGIESLKALRTPATTWLDRTPRGGVHQWFRHPGVPIGNRAGLRPHLDVRGDGGYVVAPPSVRDDGRRYEWLTSPDRCPLEPLPEPVLALLVAPPAATVPPTADQIPEGQRNDTLYRLARSLMRRGLSAGAVHVAVAEENRARCRPPLPEREVRVLVEHALMQPHRPDFAEEPAPPAIVTPIVVDWTRYLYDAAEVDAWDFPPVQFLVEGLLPLLGVVWWGGMPKRFKSLMLLYLCLAVHCGREKIAGRFPILARPRMLYVSREDGGSRLKGRTIDICTPWGRRPDRGAIRFMVRPVVDLIDQATIDGLVALCVEEDRHVIVLDTWTALSPTADPMAAKDQAVLAAAVVRLAERISGLVVVVDHSRKNRPEGQAMSSADIHGPYVKWASAEHIVMLDTVADKPAKRIEVFIEGKDADTDRLFLTVSPKGALEGEKFTYAGSAAALTEARVAVGSTNRSAVLAVIQKAPDALTAVEVVERLLKAGTPLGRSATINHLNALIREGRAKITGELKETRYFALDVASTQPSWTQKGDGQ
jgi:hypothetical protein